MDGFILTHICNTLASSGVRTPYRVYFDLCLPVIIVDYPCIVDNDVDSAECLLRFLESLWNDKQ